MASREHLGTLLRPIWAQAKSRHHSLMGYGVVELALRASSLHLENCDIGRAMCGWGAATLAE